MPRKDKDFLGLEVISLKDASVIGEIDGLIVDETKDSVAGLVVNIGIKEAKVLSFADIASIGNDAVMVESEQVVCLVSGHAELQEIAERNIFLNGSLALTDSGDIAGAVADYYVDPKTGAITAIEIVPADEDSEEDIMIPATEIVRIGPDLVMITSDYMSKAVSSVENL